MVETHAQKRYFADAARHSTLPRMITLLVGDSEPISVSLNELRYPTCLRDIAVCKMILQEHQRGRPPMSAYRTVAKAIGVSVSGVRLIWERSGAKGGAV